MEVTLSVPPNSQAFDPANHSVSLLQPGAHPQRQLLAPKALIAVPTSDIGQLSTILTTLIRAGITQGHAASKPLVAPLTPKAKQSESVSKALVPTSSAPSGLPCFLSYACTNLGVWNDMDFESPLHHKWFGPDILSQAPDSSIVGLGLSEGDILRLKNGSQKWWNGPNAKHQQSEAEAPKVKKKATTNHNDEDNSFEPQSHEVSAEQCHYEY